MFGVNNELFKVLVLIFVLEKSSALNLQQSFVDITEISLYLQHFNHESLFGRTSQLTVVKSVRNKRANYLLNELLDEYSKDINDDFKIIMKEVNLLYENTFDYVNVVFIDSYESFEEIRAGPTAAAKDFSEYYIIVYYSIDENAENDIQKIFNYCWQYYIVNVALLLKTEAEAPIKLYTYYPFTKKSCKNAQIHVISQNESILQLKHSDIFPEKFKKFYNCSIRAALWNAPPYMILPPEESATKEMAGFEGYILNVLSEVLEFQIDYVVPPNDEQRGIVTPDGKLTGALKMLKDRSADLSMGSFRCTLERSTVSSPSKTFYQTMQVFTVLSLRQPWSSLEIIVFPFQFHIWLVLVLLLIFLLCLPGILKVYSPNALKFIYGFSSVYCINTNIVGITLNQNAKFVPKRNFARFTLLMWILLTMIIRSIYQGVLYDFLTTDGNKALPNSAADLTKLNFKLIVNVATYDTFQDTPIIRDQLIEVLRMNISDVGGFPLLEANPGKHYVTGTPKDFLTYYISIHNKHAEFHVLREAVFAQHLCIYFTKHSYLVNPFNRILNWLRNFGLVDYWASQIIAASHLRRDSGHASNKTSLTMEQLSGIFQICLGLHCLATVVFLCEIFWFRFKK